MSNLDCYSTSWYNQPYSGGSYTAIGAGGSQADIEKMAEPLTVREGRTDKPVVLFAGEHCHPSFYSTGHGAYLTGRAAAQTAIRCARENIATALNEVTYNLQDASVTDLSAWLAELNCGDKSLEDYKVSSSRPRRDDGQYVTPR